MATREVKATIQDYEVLLAQHPEIGEPLKAIILLRLLKEAETELAALKGEISEGNVTPIKEGVGD